MAFLSHLVAFDHCRVLLPWYSWARRQNESALLHRFALALSHPQALRSSPFTRGVAASAYCFSGARQIAIHFRANHTAARRLHGVGRARQLAGLAHTAFRRNAAPNFYYIQRLFLDGRLARSEAYFEHREITLLLAALNEAVDSQQLADKLRFHDFCCAHDLPTAPILAVFRNGRLDADRSNGFAAARRTDLFVKPANEYRGLGIERWLHDAATDRYVRNAEALPAAAFLDYCAAASQGRVLLLQPRLHDHADLAPLSNGAVCNLRVITGLASDGEPQLLSAALRMPAGDTFLTDYLNDVFAAAVDLHTGTLGAAELKDLHRGSFAAHPDTGAPIAGHRLTHWESIRALVVRAHRHCPWMPFVGWDVVDTATGPCLLEANAFWGGNLAQMAGNRPLGETSFPSLYLHHLRKLRPDLLPLLV